MTAEDNLDFPLAQVAKQAEEDVRNGCQVFQKFTCEKCGNRLTIEEPNTFYTTGSCDNCQHVTDITLRGCNYLSILMMKGTPS